MLNLELSRFPLQCTTGSATPVVPPPLNNMLKASVNNKATEPQNITEHATTSEPQFVASKSAPTTLASGHISNSNGQSIIVAPLHTTDSSGQTLPKPMPSESLPLQQAISQQISEAQEQLFRSTSHEIPSNANLSDITYQECFKEYATKQSLNKETATKIEESTRGQSDNPRWFYERVGRITASKFGSVNVRRRTTPPDALVKEIMNYAAVGNPEKTRRRIPAMVHGQQMEAKAREAYIKYKELNGSTVKVQSCGLFVNEQEPWCGASPDGLVYEQRAEDPDGLLEFKCPYLETFCVAEELINTRKQFYLKKEGDSVVINKKHQYYAQVQGQMGITGRKWTDFVVYIDVNSQTDIVVHRVSFDKDYWQSLNSKIFKFYFQFVVAEIFSKRVFAEIPLYPELFSYSSKNTQVQRES